MIDQRTSVSPGDLMKSERLLIALAADAYAATALDEFFILHGRRRFTPDITAMRSRIWRGRGGRQAFARAISVLHARGFIRWHPGDRYEVITRDLMTAAECIAEYPGADLQHGLSWPERMSQ